MRAVSVWDHMPSAAEILDKRLAAGWRPTASELQEGSVVEGYAACVYSGLPQVPTSTVLPVACIPREVSCRRDEAAPMKISARIRNGAGQHVAEVETAGARKAIAIPAKQGGSGSSVNGGELLFLALATCYCNDVYREAAKRGIAIEWVEVYVAGEFGGEGEPARHIEYSARVAGAAPESELRELLSTTDRLAEIQNTLRGGVDIRLGNVEVVCVQPGGGSRGASDG